MISNNLNNQIQNKNLILLNDIKQMRNLESHWQNGCFLYKEDTNKVIIKLNTKKASQLFLTRDLYNNNFINYNNNLNKLLYTVPIHFWCDNMENNLKFKNPLNDLISTKHNFQNIFLKKKKVLFFLKLKNRSKIVSQKVINNISRISDDNILKYNVLALKCNKNLFKILLKNNIKKRTFKTELILKAFKLNLFLFLLKCNFSRTRKKKKFKYFYFSKNKYFYTLGQSGLRSRGLDIAKRHFQVSTKRINYFNNVELGFQLNNKKYWNKSYKNINIGFLSKNQIYKNNRLYKKYFNNWFYIKKKLYYNI